MQYILLNTITTLSKHVSDINITYYVLCDILLCDL